MGDDRLRAADCGHKALRMLPPPGEMHPGDVGPQSAVRSRSQLAALLVAILLAACDRLPPWLGGERPPPFELFGRDDMRPGVSIETLKEAAARESRVHRWRCRPLWARAQSCALTVQPGDLRALVDSTGRVIRLTVVAPDSFFVWEDTPLNEPKYRYYANRLRETWDGIQPHRFGPIDAGVVEFRWVDPDGRWSAQMWYSPWSRYKTKIQSYAVREYYRDSLARVPDSISVTDEPEYSKFVALRPPPPPVEEPDPVAVDPEFAPRPEPPPPPVQAESPVPSELRSLGTGLGAALQQLAEAQRRYHSLHWKYATTLAELGWRSDDDIVLQLTGVTATGWAAVAIHRALPSRSCVYYEGSVSRTPKTFAERRPGVERSVICDSF
jgi:hypothetical protein